MILEGICVGPFQVNCYILASRNAGGAIIIDPGAQADRIKQILNRYALKPAFIINTHGHMDHIGCDESFAVPIYIHRLDLAMLKDPRLNLSHMFTSPYSVKSEIITLEDKENIALDDIELEVIHTPGHTPGGICLLMKKPKNNILFSGDSLFYQGIGRTDFSGPNGGLLISSIKDKLLKLSDDTMVYPGHGTVTTIGDEKRNNSFLA